MSPVQTIQKLIVNLSEKDQQHAEKFIKIRDFTSLRDLVKSAIIIKEKSLDSSTLENCNETLRGLEQLYAEVNDYCILLGEETEDEEEENDNIDNYLPYNEEEYGY